MNTLTFDGERIVSEAAQRHGVSFDAALTLLLAISAGGGSMAQFSHPELGGMGQWAQGGMIMVGDMFNQGLKYRVDTLCDDLANILRANSIFAPQVHSQTQYQGHATGGETSLYVSSGNWWPNDLGQPSSTGAQNAMAYACFPGVRRLAILNHGIVTVYDTGNHQIGGFSQQQGGDQSLTFSSQFGTIRVNDLPVVNAAATPSPKNQDDVFRVIEQLADLRQKGVLTDAEFAAKKSELLSRL